MTQAVTVSGNRAQGATLAKLRGAARELFVQVGYHDTRPQDIARLAGVANGTFYLHFADKQQAFLDFAEQAQNDLLEVMREKLGAVSGRQARWQVTCAALLEYGQTHRGLLQAAFLDPVFIAPNDDNAWRMYDRLGHVIHLALTDGESDELGFNTELISHGLCGMLRHALIYAGRRELDSEQVIHDLSRFIDRGLDASDSDTN